MPYILAINLFLTLFVINFCFYMHGYLQSKKEVCDIFLEALQEKKWNADTLWEKFDKQPWPFERLFRGKK